MITLLNDYYRIDGRIAKSDDTVVFNIALLPDYHVYAGHFPGNPVSPGVCNIQMIKECAEQMTGRRLFLNYIAKCRFSAILTPQTTSALQLRISRHCEERSNPDESVAGWIASTTSCLAMTGEERLVIGCEATKQSNAHNVNATLFDDTTTYIEFKGEFTTY